MRKYIFIIIGALIVLSFNYTLAQTYNGPSLYDASGKVKSIKITPSPIFSSDKIEFMEDGHIKDSTLTFDWDGKAIGKNLNIYKMRQSVNLEYDNNNRLIKAIVDSSYGLPGGYEATLNYEGDHPDRITITETKGKNPYQYSYIYSNYSFDSNGNWISREVDLSTIEMKSNSMKKKEHFTETRNILYYE